MQPSHYLQQQQSFHCDRIVNPYASTKRKYSCLAVMYAGTNISYNLLRYEDNTTPKEQLRPTRASSSTTSDNDDKEDSSQPMNSTGFFDNVANNKGRLLFSNKMQRLLTHLSSLEESILRELSQNNVERKRGQDIIVMVLNDGELDLLANFLCSLKKFGLENEVKKKILVFTSSSDALPLLRAFGVMAIHHEAFPITSRHASFEYLDPIFIEMMWYKSFSVWIMLKLQFNVLFMDIDIIFFRNPLDFFAQADPNNGVDVFLSDDGQRSLRYAPFYANSGFYYLRSNDKTIFFTWSIMTAFDLLHITGSHQNVYTIKLLEALDFYYLQTYFLSMDDFPSGVKFSHDRPFMRAINDGIHTPYIFHMCWTKNKGHKLINFREANMWYVQENTSTWLDKLGQLPEVTKGVKRDHDSRNSIRPPAYDEDNHWTSQLRLLQDEQVSKGDHKGILERNWELFAPLVCSS
eukprot:gene9418-10405_t